MATEESDRLIAKEFEEISSTVYVPSMMWIRRAVGEMLAILKMWRDHPESYRGVAWCETMGWQE